MKKNGFRIITIFEERRKLFRNFSKEKKTGVSKTFFFQFQKERIKKLSKSKRNPIFLSGFREVDNLNETKKEKNSIMNNNNWTTHKLSPPIRSMPDRKSVV